MGRDSARVLVVDDDEVVLVAICDLLEEHGFRVFTQISPIGATQVIVREKIDAAVIDVNLPDIQGDSVVRLMRTWDRLKDLPIIMISGAESAKLEQIQRDMPGIQIVPKSSMHRDLVRTLNDMLMASSRTFKRSETRDIDAGEGFKELMPAFLEELTAAVQLARQVWAFVCVGRQDQIPQLVSTLQGLRSRAQLLDLDAVHRLVSGILDVLELVKPGAKPALRVQRSVDEAIAALSAFRRMDNAMSTRSATLLRDLAGVARDMRTDS